MIRGFMCVAAVRRARNKRMGCRLLVRGLQPSERRQLQWPRLAGRLPSVPHSLRTIILCSYTGMRGSDANFARLEAEPAAEVRLL